MEAVHQAWSRYLSSKAAIDLLETSLLACISRLEDVETQLQLAVSRGVAVQGGVASVGATLAEYRHGLDKLHIAKQTCLDKCYAAFYEALTAAAKLSVGVLPRLGSSDGTGLACALPVDTMKIFIEYFGGLTDDINNPAEGHYVRVPDLSLPPKTQTHLEDLKGHFEAAIGTLDTKVARMEDIKVALNANLGMGFPLQKSIDDLQTQQDQWEASKEALLEEASQELSSVLDDFERCLEPLRVLGSAFQDPPETLPLDCVP